MNIVHIIHYCSVRYCFDRDGAGLDKWYTGRKKRVHDISRFFSQVHGCARFLRIFICIFSGSGGFQSAQIIGGLPGKKAEKEIILWQ